LQDASLRHTLQFGVGLHHAGLSENDRTLVERLYVDGTIQVLVATSTLAWGVNTPAHLVIVKGTEFYDASTKRYVDYPITDVLQMMGRAGRPQYDKHGVAVIMVHEPKKSFYKKFLYEPFPVESSLHLQLEDHLNAEIATGTIQTRQDCIDYLTWTFFLRRLMQNPTYYGLQNTDPESVSSFLSLLIDSNLEKLEEASCIEVDEETDNVKSTFLGEVASLYYLQYGTMSVFSSRLTFSMDVKGIINVLCQAKEYDELPVRHNEDNLNAEMLHAVRYPPAAHLVDKPNCKAELLIQAHFSRLSLPISDYITDTRTVLDNSMRILQAMIDICAENSWWRSCHAVMKTIQCMMQARWDDDDTLMQIPGISSKDKALKVAKKLKVDGIQSLVKLFKKQRQKTLTAIQEVLGPSDMKAVTNALSRMPDVSVDSHFSSSAKTYIEIKVIRHGFKPTKGTLAPKAFAPCFPKVKEESWWCAIVNGEDLIGLKRFSFGTKSILRVHLEDSPELMRLLESGKPPVVHLICDSYAGFDVQQTPDLVDS
jgi:activating signal cointegrator complex subunit 3